MFESDLSTLEPEIPAVGAAFQAIRAVRLGVAISPLGAALPALDSGLFSLGQV